eukprot:g3611.t1
MRQGSGAVLVEPGTFERHIYVQITVNELQQRSGMESEFAAAPEVGDHGPADDSEQAAHNDDSAGSEGSQALGTFMGSGSASSFALEILVLEPKQELGLGLVVTLGEIERVLVDVLEEASRADYRSAMAFSSSGLGGSGSSASLKALAAWMNGSAAMPRRQLVRLLLERLRVEEEPGGEARLKLHVSPTDAEQQLGPEERRRKEALLAAMEDNAAVMIQTAFRGNLARAEFARKRKEYDAKIRTENATMIQSAWRGRAAQKRVAAIKKEYDEKIANEKAVLIQRLARGKLARLAFQNAKTEEEKEAAAALMLQCAWRSRQARTKVAALTKEKYDKMAEDAAIMVQCAWRSKKAREKVNQLKAEKQAALEEQAAIMLQCAWRGRLARRKLGELMQERDAMERGAGVIQRAYRGAKGRRDYDARLEAAFDKRQKDRAAADVQRAYRGKKARSFAEQRRQSGAARESMAKAKRRHEMAVKIQTATRGCLARWYLRNTKNDKEREIAFAIMLQAAFRGRRDRERVRKLQEEIAATKGYLQQRANANKGRVKALEEAAHLHRETERKAALALRRRQAMSAARNAARAHAAKFDDDRALEQKAEHEAAVMIQTAFRGNLARAEFARKRKEYDAKIRTENATMIQSAWRGRAAQKRVAAIKKEYDEKIANEKAVLIQRLARGKLARLAFQNAKTEEEKEAAAALMLQCAWRSRQARTKVAALTKEKYDKMAEDAAIMVQCAWRSKKAREKVNQLKAEKQAALEEQAAIMLQCAWRGRKARQKYHILAEAKKKRNASKKRQEKIEAERAAQNEKREAMRRQMREWDEAEKARRAAAA